MKIPPDPSKATQHELEEWMTSLTDEEARTLFDTLEREMKRRGQIAGKAEQGEMEA